MARATSTTTPWSTGGAAGTCSPSSGRARRAARPPTARRRSPSPTPPRRARAGRGRATPTPSPSTLPTSARNTCGRRTSSRPTADSGCSTRRAARAVPRSTSPPRTTCSPGPASRPARCSGAAPRGTRWCCESAPSGSCTTRSSRTRAGTTSWRTGGPPICCAGASRGSRSPTRARTRPSRSPSRRAWSGGTAGTTCSWGRGAATRARTCWRPGTRSASNSPGTPGTCPVTPSR